MKASRSFSSMTSTEITLPLLRSFRQTNRDALKSLQYFLFLVIFLLIFEDQFFQQYLLLLKLSLNFIGDRSNANADSALVTTQKAITYNELNSELYKKFFLTRNEEKAMSDGYIYIHDRGSRLDSMNCCLFDMPSVLKDSLTARSKILLRAVIV